MERVGTALIMTATDGHERTRMTAANQSYSPGKSNWGSREAPPWFLSDRRPVVNLWVGPHRKSGVIRKRLLPVDFACPCTHNYHRPGQESSP